MYKTHSLLKIHTKFLNAKINSKKLNLNFPHEINNQSISSLHTAPPTPWPAVILPASPKGLNVVIKAYTFSLTHLIFMALSKVYNLKYSTYLV